MTFDPNEAQRVSEITGKTTAGWMSALREVLESHPELPPIARMQLAVVYEVDGQDYPTAMGWPLDNWEGHARTCEEAAQIFRHAGAVQRAPKRQG